MSPAEIIERANDEGVLLALSPSGSISAKGNQSAIDCWLPTIKQSKAAIIAALQLDRRRAKVLAMLDADPELQLAVVVDEPDADPVIVMVARRGYTGEIEIPRITYDPRVLMELLDRNAAGDEP